MGDKRSVITMDQDRQDVEPAVGVAESPLHEVPLGDLLDLILLGGGHGLLGKPKLRPCPRLDLDEHERRPVIGDDVELAAKEPVAALDDPEFLFWGYALDSRSHYI